MDGRPQSSSDGHRQLWGNAILYQQSIRRQGRLFEQIDPMGKLPQRYSMNVGVLRQTRHASLSTNA